MTSSRDVSRISPEFESRIPNSIPESNHRIVSESLKNITYRRQKALHSFYRDISTEPHTLLSTERYTHSDPEDPDPEDPDLDLATPVPGHKARLTKTLEPAGNDHVTSPSPIPSPQTVTLGAAPDLPKPWWFPCAQNEF